MAAILGIFSVGRGGIAAGGTQKPLPFAGDCLVSVGGSRSSRFASGPVAG